MTFADRMAALAVVMLWGFNFVAAKIGTGALPPFLLTGLRFAAVGAMLAPFARPARHQWGGVLLVSLLLGVLHFGLLFFGIAGTGAAVGAIGIQTSVPFAALLAAIFFKDRLGWKRGFGMALAFGGVALLAGEPTRPDMFAFAMVLTSAFCWALANVAIKRLGRINSLALNGWMAVFSAPQLLLLSALFEDNQIQALANAGWRGYGAVAYTALGASVIAYSLWYRLIGKYAMTQVVPFTMLGPVVGVGGGILLLDEPFTWYKLAGGLITIAGVAVIQFCAPGRPPAAPAPAKDMGQP